MEQFLIIYFMIGLGVASAGRRVTRKFSTWMSGLFFWPVIVGYGLGLWTSLNIVNVSEKIGEWKSEDL